MKDYRNQPGRSWSRSPVTNGGGGNKREKEETAGGGVGGKGTTTSAYLTKDVQKLGEREWKEKEKVHPHTEVSELLAVRRALGRPSSGNHAPHSRKGSRKKVRGGGLQEEEKCTSPKKIA